VDRCPQVWGIPANRGSRESPPVKPEGQGGTGPFGNFETQSPTPPSLPRLELNVAHIVDEKACGHHRAFRNLEAPQCLPRGCRFNARDSLWLMGCISSDQEVHGLEVCRLTARASAAGNGPGLTQINVPYPGASRQPRTAPRWKDQEETRGA
jgi:hypothetical protein